MKLLIVTVAITALVQMSMAGPMVRYKRSERFSQVFGDETIFSSCWKEIPRTHEYEKYLSLFEAYLNDMDELTRTSGSCLKKSAAGLLRMVQFSEALGAIDPQNLTREGQEMNRILENNGGNEFVDNLKTFADNFKNLNIDSELEKITDADALRIAQFAQVC